MINNKKNISSLIEPKLCLLAVITILTHAIIMSFFNKPIQTNQSAWLCNQSGGTVKNTRLQVHSAQTKIDQQNVQKCQQMVSFYWDATEKIKFFSRFGLSIRPKLKTLKPNQVPWYLDIKQKRQCKLLQVPLRYSFSPNCISWLWTCIK